MDPLPTNESALAENIALKAQLAALVAELKEKGGLIAKFNELIGTINAAGLLPIAPIEEHFAKDDVVCMMKAAKYASALHEIDSIARNALKHGVTEESFSRALERIREEVSDVYDVMDGV